MNNYKYKFKLVYLLTLISCICIKLHSVSSDFLAPAGYSECGLNAIETSVGRVQLPALAFIDQPFDKLDEIDLFFTLRCPLRCPHCYWAEILKRMPSMTKEQLDEIIGKINNFEGINKINISGGEPFTKPALIHQA
ncbi:MAG: radical SAM protein, partial [bacterium]